MEPVVNTREVLCKSSAAALWPYVADTDRLNRIATMEAVTLERHSGPGPARFTVRTRLGGDVAEYEEPPYEFVAPHRYAVRREIRQGRFSLVEMGAHLEPIEGGGTRVTFRLAMTPRLGLIRPFVRRGGQKVLDDMAAAIARVDEALARGEWGHGLLGGPKSPVDSKAFSRASAELLRTLPADKRNAGERLVAFVRDASDSDVMRVRPFEVADAWGIERGAVLTACLTGVVAGLLELSWELVCPSCRMGAGQADKLEEIVEGQHCHMCDLSFGLALDRAVEATFRPAPAVRRVPDAPYCVGGPALTPHVVTQAIVDAGGQRTVDVPEQPGRYRLFARGGAAASVDVVAGAASEVSASAGTHFLPAHLDVAPGGRIAVANLDATARHLKLEKSEYAGRAATAYHVTSNATFRRLFSDEILRTGVMLQVTRVALLFSDLTGSTALYTRAGDATAFKLVQDHFELLRTIIDAHEGAVVKTIGDAVMASFVDEESAVRAGVAMQRAWPAFREARGDHAPDVFLKVGVFAGPCYAVTANKVLDYFGQSVNMAARLQGSAEAGEVVVPAELAERGVAQGWLEQARILEIFDAHLKGLAAPVRAARIVSV